MASTKRRQVGEKGTLLILCKGNPHIAGAQLYLTQIVPKLQERYKIVFSFRAMDGTGFLDPIRERVRFEVYEYDWRHMKPLESFRTAYRMFREIRPEVVLFNGSEDQMLSPIWAARFAGTGKRNMVVHWSTTPEELPWFRRKAGLPIPSRYSIVTRLKRSVAYRFLDRVIFVNRITREAFLKLYFLKMERCLTIHNGIEWEKYQQGNRKVARSGLGVDDQEIMILATGNLTEVKGHRYLIRCVKELVSDGANVKCFIAGQGELKDDLEKLVSHLGLEGSVRFLGYREDIPDLLAATDIYCMPSLNEALGYGLLEAMAAGKAVVASRVGGIPEVVEDGIDGILVPGKSAGDLKIAISRLISDDGLRNRLGENGKEKVVDIFNMDRMLRQTQMAICG